MVLSDSRLLIALIINRLPSLRVVERRKLFDAALTFEQYTQITIPQIGEIVGRRLHPRSFDRKKILLLAERDYNYLQVNDIKMVLFEQMPSFVQQIADPPFLLFVRGKLPLSKKKSLAVVGTRRPSAVAARASFMVGSEIADEGITLVSGLAFGVDANVMKGATRSAGRVVAVLGNGIDYIYPAQHKNIARKILEHDGAIVSEYSPGMNPLRHHFPARNRIISALSRATLLIEAPQRSGALITTEYALQQGRDLFVHAVSLDPHTSVAAEGGRALIADGVKVMHSVKQLRSLWGYTHLSEDVCDTSTSYCGSRSIKRHVDRISCRLIYGGCQIT